MRRVTRSSVLLWVLAAPLVALILLPVGGLVARTTPQALWTALHTDTVQQALFLSARTTALTLLCTIVCGTAVAIRLAPRSERTASLERLIDLPTVLPPAIAGIALLSVFGRMGWFGQLLANAGIQIPFTTTAVVLAQLFVAAPLYIRACVHALRGLDPLLTDAAAIDGASPLDYARYIAVPLMRGQLQAGIAQTTARALGEFGATALFAGSMPGVTRTMALAIYVNAESDPPSAVAMSVVLLGVALCLLWIAQPAERA